MMLPAVYVRSVVGILLALLVAKLPAQDATRLHTNRPAGRELIRLPKEDDAFGFIVFGDRTGGPPEGIKVLAQAVADTNLLDPDLVFTVGDLVQGYNTTAQWVAQANEYKETMAKLRMPWFPVAGNHDIYWRGPGKPAGEHEQNFETHFGPLWYAVEHKKCWFIALHSDEGNPATGERNFRDPAAQRISEAQFTWLQGILDQAKGARHVFLFLHHPRWLARYGEDWQRVHQLLAKAGNVKAVFAGHIHNMQYGGTRDGIEYYTVASVGAHLEMELPEAGFLHQYHVVTVRPQGIVVAAIPVGAVMDPQPITEQLSDDVMALNRGLRAEVASFVAAGAGAPIASDGEVDAVLTLALHNPSTRAIDLELIPAASRGYVFAPDHQHLVVPPGAKGTTTFAVRRQADAKLPFALPEMEMRCDYLASHRRIPMPRRTVTLELPPPRDLGASAGPQGVLVLDGKTAALAVTDRQLQLPDGPMTVEGWLCAAAYDGRRAFLAKTQQSEFGLFVSDGRPEFMVFLGDRYASAVARVPMLEADRWHHLAGVYDGAELRLYVDGELVATGKGSGERKRNSLPLLVAADPDGNGAPTSLVGGRADEVRISKVARYAGARFAPALRHVPDADTVLLLALDGEFGPWVPDASPTRSHAQKLGAVRTQVEPGPAQR